MRTHTINNGIKEFILRQETYSFKFTPTPNFYKTVQIGQKRWGQIFRNEKPVTLSELQNLADYFRVNINQFISTIHIVD